jgi:hypothetical protein
MRKKDIRVLFIFYRLLSRRRTIGIPSKHCSRIDRLINLVEKNKGYKIILVCKTKHLQKLYNIATGRYIHKIYIFGQNTDVKITNKDITIINTNQNDLLFHLLCATIRYAHREELIERKSENHGLANALTTDILKLLDRLENLSQTRS